MSPKFYTATEAFSGILNATSGLKLRDCARKSTTKCINSEIEETSDDEIDLYDPDTTWSSESVAFKQFLKRLNSQRQKPSRQQIYSFFTSLRLNDRKINQIDSEFLNLSDLIELSLTGNYLDSVQSLPSNIEVLHLNANRLTLLPHLGVLSRLVHLGLSHNFISSPMNGTAKVQIPDSLISVDLSYNSISNLYEWTETLKEAKNLRLLTLMGNPISLMRNYRNNVVNRLPQIRILDDIPICDRDQEHKNEITAITPSADVLFKVGKVRNLPMPSRADDQRHSQSAMPDECFFAIRFSFLGNGDSNSIISDDKKYSSEVDFEFEKIVTFDISEKLRDSLQKGILLTIVRRKYNYVSKQSTDSSPGVHNIDIEQINKGSAKIKNNKKPGKKSHAEDIATHYDRNLCEESKVAETVINVSKFLESEHVLKQTVKLPVTVTGNSNSLQVQSKISSESTLMDSRVPNSSEISVSLLIALNPDVGFGGFDLTDLEADVAVGKNGDKRGGKSK